MYNNVDLISETYNDIASGKLQIRLFQPPHCGFVNDILERNAFEYLE